MRGAWAQGACAAGALLVLFSMGAVGCRDSGAETGWQERPVTNVSVDDFSLFDHLGGFHTLRAYADAPAIVLFVQGNGCPIARNAVHALRAVRERYRDRGVVFLLLNASPQDDRDAVAQEAAAFGIDFPILVDETQLVGASLDVRRTAEVLLIDPKTWRTVYRGPVDDRLHYEAQKVAASRAYLVEALEAHLAGAEVPEAVVPSPGCLIAYPDRGRARAISYADEVAPILQARCQGCHRPGGIAPWAMTSYEMVRGWAPMMREVLRTKRMPPWHADPHVGTFRNDLSLTREEVTTLVRWIEAGAPRGEGADPLKAARAEAPEWVLGTPDLVLDLGPQALPPTGVLDYRYVRVAVPVERDVWVRAVDVRPGNQAALHHVLTWVIYPEGYPASGDPGLRWRDAVFAAYAPGMGPEVFPEGTGRLLPAGSVLEFQLHYTTTGRPETDASRLGLYFAETPPARPLQITAAVNTDFEIPPGAREHEEVAEHRFDRDVVLYSMLPHMHFRGRRMSYEAHYPDGRTERLLSVPNYQFNWQRYYELATPKRLPAGTRIVCRAAYDNSARNPFNPDPSATVRWGDQSFDEMFIGYLVYAEADGAPQPLRPASASP